MCAISTTNAMTAPAAVRQFFKTGLQQVCHFKVDVIARNVDAAAYKNYQRQEYQDLHNSSVAIMVREMQREVDTRHPFESSLHIDHSTNNHPPQLRAPMILIVALWLFSHRESQSGPDREKTPEQFA